MLKRIAAGFNPVSIGLGVTMTVGYGVLYYSFAILAPAVRAEFGWSRTFVFGAFSFALLAGALMAPLAGSLIDSIGGKKVLIGGTIASSLALAALSMTQTKLAYVATLFVVEGMSVFVLYEAGFAALTQYYGRDARPRISAVTLIAGFSSTVFWPLCGLLLSFMTWREVYMALAAINLLICLPIHLWLPKTIPSKAVMPTHSAPSEAVASTAGQTTRRWPVMACLAIAFAANGFVIASVQTGFPALFADAGYSVAAAAGFAALIGPSQVVARVIEILFGQTRSPIAVGVAADAALAFGVASLLALALTPAAGVFFALFFGAGQGVAYVIRGAIPLALFGPAGYGALTGRLSSVRIVFSALAPVAIAWTTENLGNDVAIILLIATALLSVSALALLRRVAA